MKPAILLLVRSRSGAATALAEVGRRRAHELGLSAQIVPVRDDYACPPLPGDEAVTALVPVDFAARQHEAWCLLCQLSLLRCEIGFTILVLGTDSDAGLQAHQRTLIAQSRAPRAPRHASVRIA